MVAIVKQNMQKRDYENILPKILVHELQALTHENTPARQPNGQTLYQRSKGQLNIYNICILCRHFYGNIF